MVDKEKILAEIERRIAFHKERSRTEDSSICDVLLGISSFINSLPEEPVNEEIRIDTIKEVKEIFKKELLRLQKEQKMKFETEPTEHRVGSLECINNILSSFEFVNFEEEPVNEDLEETAKDGANKEYPPEYEMSDDNWKQRAGYVKGFKAGSKWDRQRTISKACEFITQTSKGLERDDDVKEFIEQFKKAMED